MCQGLQVSVAQGAEFGIQSLVTDIEIRCQQSPEAYNGELVVSNKEEIVDARRVQEPKSS